MTVIFGFLMCLLWPLPFGERENFYLIRLGGELNDKPHCGHILKMNGQFAVLAIAALTVRVRGSF
jgi:hypothetical protein